jgi:hypothetical protein
MFVSYPCNSLFIGAQELKVHFVYSAQVLLSRLNFFGSKQISNAENEGLKMYRDTAEAVICGLIPDSPQATASRTGGGGSLLFVTWQHKEDTHLVVLWFCQKWNL